MPTSSQKPLLAETERAQAWLDHFLVQDQPTALNLLGNLELISRDAFERDLVEELDACLKEIERPVAMYTAREIKANHRYFTKAGPKAVNASRGVGSEGDLAHLVRDLCREYGLLDHPSIELMRSERVRSIIVLNDFVASGDQTREFLDNIYSDPAIKSWVSGGKLKIIAIVHSATDGGLKYVRKGKVHWSIRPARVMGDLANGLDQAQEQRIKALCKEYGKRWNIPSNWWLGYKKTFSGVIFPHKCPNTSPGILWYDYAGHGKPLIRQRASFDFPVWPVAISTQDQLRRLFAISGQDKLAALHWVNHLGPDAALKIGILAVASRRVRYRAEMAERLRVSSARLDVLLKECVTQGWLTSRGCLTDQGNAILAQAKGLGIKTARTEWSDPDEFYFLSDVGDHGEP